MISAMAIVPSVRRFLISSILLSFCLQLAAGVTTHHHQEADVTQITRKTVYGIPF